jgi:hypothetical protein
LVASPGIPITTQLTQQGGTTLTTLEVATNKPDEFCAGGESPPNAIPPELAEELAQIIADALHEDIKQFPKLSDIPPASQSTLCSWPRSPRACRTRRTTPKAAPTHEIAV